MKRYKNETLIDRYITGKLEDTELWEFKTNLSNNPGFAQEVELRKELYSTISNKRKMQLLKTLRNINQEGNTKKVLISSWKFRAIAASIVVLMVVGSTLMSNYIKNNNLSNKDIYNEYFVDEGSLLLTRAAYDMDISSTKAGVILYDNKKYDEAIRLFKATPDNVMTTFYCGLSYMKINDFDNAEKQFIRLIKNKDNIFVDQAEWNLGLSYLANNKVKQAIRIFEKISSENGAYKLQATNILDEINTHS